MKATLGSVVHSFLEDHLVVLKGLRPSSVRSYRDVLQLFLVWVAHDARRRISRLSLADLSCERVHRFLRHLEEERGNHVRTRNHRLAVLHVFFDYVASMEPLMLAVAEQVAAIPAKRTPPAETRFLERAEIATVFEAVAGDDWMHRRDRTLLLFLYNTGARVQEAADLRAGHIEFGPLARVRLHGKGDKWRVCPLWSETAASIRRLLDDNTEEWDGDSPVFASRNGSPLTRSGIYKIVRRRTSQIELKRGGALRHGVSPHVFRHTTAVHLLEAGVEINVISGWLGHVSLDTTSRYAEIGTRTKEQAMRLCEPPVKGAEFPRKPVWRDDESLLKWLKSL